MGALSKTELQFVKGDLKPTDEYRRVLLHRIKKKREQMEKELQLITEFLEKHST